MPYIAQDSRFQFMESVEHCVNGIEKIGEINYVITLLLHRWLQRNTMSYATLNALIGVLECAKLELYRKVVALYEDDKQAENGPVSALGGGS